MRKTNLVARIAVATASLLACTAVPAAAGTNTIVFTQVGEHAMTVPSGVTSLHVVAVGGRGGGSPPGAAAGFGARVAGDLAVQAGDVRYFVVGGNGFNGDYAGGGGGASDARTAPVSAGLTPTDPRQLIAAGGGGAGRGIIDNRTPEGGGGDGGQPGQSSRLGSGVTTPSGGGDAGVPAGTGAGGVAGVPGSPAFGAPGLAGERGVGGTGAYPGGNGLQGWGGYNGGGLGGGYNTGVTLYLGGGGGGGGLNGGGGGGGMINRGGAAYGGGGGGGGSNLVPADGNATASTSGAGSVTVSFDDMVAPAVTLDEVPARSRGGTFTFRGTSGTALGDGAVTIKVYAGLTVDGALASTLSPGRDASTGAWQDSRSWFATDGTYTIQASQVDGGGNVGFSVARTVVFDRTDPAPSLTAPANGSLLTGSAPVFSGIAGTATGDAASVEVDVRDATNALVETVSGQRDGTTGAYAIEASPALGDGRYTAVVYQSDDVGNAGASAAVAFRIDTQAPVPTLTSPAAPRSGDATPTFAGTGATATDDADTVDVRIHAGESTAGAVLQTLNVTLDGTGAYVVDAAPLDDGVYTAQTSQSDLAGHVGGSAPQTFTVDTTAPTVTLDVALGATAPALSTFAGSGGTAVGDDATVTLEVYAGSSAMGPLIASIEPTRDGQTGEWTATAPFTLATGTYTSVATQRDDIGNTATSAAKTFEIAAPPIVVPPPVVPPPVVPPPVVPPPVVPPAAVPPAVVPAVVPPIALPPSTEPPAVFPPGAVDTTAPALSRVGLSATRFAIGRVQTAHAVAGQRLPRGTAVRYTLSEPATVTITITRSGRARAVGTLTRRSAKGAGHVAFSGRIGRRALPSGRYVMTLRAADAAGNRSARKQVSFRIG